MSDDYSVTGQTESTVIAPSGKGFQKVWDITFRIESGPARGAEGTVTVPDSDHNADYIQNAIEDKVTNMQAIASLGSARSK